MAIDLKKYLKAENPHIWLFNGKEPDGRYSMHGLFWVMRENLSLHLHIRCLVPAAGYSLDGRWKNY